MDRFALLLVIIGALNWGSIGIFGYDFIGWVTGGITTTLARIIFTVVGLAGVWCISLLFREETVVEHHHDFR